MFSSPSKEREFCVDLKEHIKWRPFHINNVFLRYFNQMNYVLEFQAVCMVCLSLQAAVCSGCGLLSVSSPACQLLVTCLALCPLYCCCSSFSEAGLPFHPAPQHRPLFTTAGHCCPFLYFIIIFFYHKILLWGNFMAMIKFKYSTKEGLKECGMRSDSPTFTGWCDSQVPSTLIYGLG